VRTDRADAAAGNLLSEQDLYLFNEGTHRHLADKLGAHLLEGGGTSFAVWAPNATAVSVLTEQNHWQVGADPLRPRASSGIWEGVLPGVGDGALYKFAITTRDGRVLEKADPYALRTEQPPRTASIVANLTYDWNDEEWMAQRGARDALDAPISVYEVHLGSFARPDEREGFCTYEELTDLLIEHVKRNGFTHVELMPVMEHPFYGSWGYQVTGFFAPTARYGTPTQFMAMVDRLHQAGIGVILDWVPSHFPNDAFALASFDGTHLYEHEDPRLGEHPDWGSLIFNYGRHEVRSFLLSSAEHWLGKYHADGLRVDAVASMLYLDYSRKAGEWIPNRLGGRENLDAIEFLRALNIGAYGEHPGIQMIAEESTAWPGVSRPVELGGLGFGMKWDMGWMHDTLQYVEREPVHRRFHHHELTFRGLYAFSENYMLPLSHDEVTHGKGSLLSRLPGDDWQRFATLRTLLAYQFTSPGKKLLFMGAELAQWREWDHDSTLDWQLLEYPLHEGVRRLVADLNAAYRDEPALHQLDCDPAGFGYVESDDAAESTLSYLRRDRDGNTILVCSNFTPVPRPNHRIGVPLAGSWTEILNTDAEIYGGSGWGNAGGVEALATPLHDWPAQLSVTLPPLGTVLLRRPSS
jgi:1,4-alpha-glucan branching enzyme